MNQAIDDKLKIKIQNKFKNTLEETADNPVLKAFITWRILSEQLRAILGGEVHNQWFNKVQPLVLKDNVLLLQTETRFAAQWINTHYQELVDTIILSHDKKYSCFFIAPKKRTKSLSKSA